MDEQKLTGLTSAQLSSLRRGLASIAESKSTSDGQRLKFKLLDKCFENLSLSAADLDENTSYFFNRRIENFRGLLNELILGQQGIITVKAIDALLDDFYVLHLEKLLIQSLHGELFEELQRHISSGDTPVAGMLSAKQNFYLFSLPSLILSFAYQNRVATTEAKLAVVVSEVNHKATAIDGWDSKLSSWQTKVDDLASNLKDQTEKLSFVGLSKAFTNLTTEKAKERNFHATASIAIACTLVLIPLCTVAISLFFSKNPLSELANWIPVLAIELILLFLLRVELQQYNSAKAQLLQFSHRRELCAFIEGYASFIEKIRSEAGAETLAKFESIIFSGISLDPMNVPNHFDGMEQFEKIIQAIRGK